MILLHVGELTVQDSALKTANEGEILQCLSMHCKSPHEMTYSWVGRCPSLGYTGWPFHTGYQSTYVDGNGRLLTIITEGLKTRPMTKVF